VELQAVIEELRLPADLVVGEGVRRVAVRLLVLRIAVTILGDARDGTVERTRPETLREGVVGHDVGSDVPGQVAAAAEATVDLVEILPTDAGVTGGAGTVGTVLAPRRRGVLRAGFELGVAIPARAAGDGQHLGNDVEVRGAEHCRLLVAALGVFAERSGVAARTR